jgi:hypothetical protein
MKKTVNKIDLDKLKSSYSDIDCFFTYYDGDNSSFDFYGNSLDGTELRITIGGCPAWIKNFSFGVNHPLTLKEALNHHIRYLSATTSDGSIIYENFFDVNQKPNTNEQ